MKKNLYLALAVIALAVIGGIFYLKAGNKEQATPAKKSKIRILYNEASFQNDLIINVAQKEGFFGKNNLEIEKVKTNKQNTAVLASGEADVMLTVSATPMLNYAKEGDLHWIGNINNYPPEIYFVSRFPEGQLSKAKNVAVNRIGGVQQIAFGLASEALGIDKTGVKYVVGANDQANVALLQKGEADLAIITSDKLRSELTKDGKYFAFAPKDSFKDSNFPTGIFVADKYVLANKDQLKGLTKAIRESIDYINSNEAKTIDFIKANYKKSDNDAKTVYGEVKKSMEKLSFVPKASELQKLYNEVTSIAEVKNPKPLEGFIDASFAD